jgi:hypothetical protein
LISPREKSDFVRLAGAEYDACCARVTAGPGALLGAVKSAIAPDPPLAYRSDVHVVVETAPFIAAAKAARLSEGDVGRIIDHLARRPDAGDLIQGTGGARKVRFAARGKGKSGGYRVITFYTGADLPVFLLTVFAKGERSDLSKAERNALARLTKALAASYPAGAGKPG